MKNMVRLTENDISNLVAEALAEIGWETPNDLYVTHKDGARYLEGFAEDLSDFVDKWADGYTEMMKANNINSLRQPIKGKVLQFINQAREMVDWCNRKSEQIKGFRRSSEDRFSQEHGGRDMRGYMDDYERERDELFDRYSEGEIDGDEYDAEMRDLENRYRDVGDITRY